MMPGPAGKFRTNYTTINDSSSFPPTRCMVCLYPDVGNTNVIFALYVYLHDIHKFSKIWSAMVHYIYAYNPTAVCLNTAISSSIE